MHRLDRLDHRRGGSAGAVPGPHVSRETTQQRRAPPLPHRGLPWVDSDRFCPCPAGADARPRVHAVARSHQGTPLSESRKYDRPTQQTNRQPRIPRRGRTQIGPPKHDGTRAVLATTRQVLAPDSAHCPMTPSQHGSSRVESRRTNLHTERMFHVKPIPAGSCRRQTSWSSRIRKAELRTRRQRGEGLTAQNDGPPSGAYGRTADGQSATQARCAQGDSPSTLTGTGTAKRIRSAGP